ncbi:MAG: S8 family peptidase [Candidatus Kariarchaeaceae archaeon]|jgi:hypothetical protein
MREKITPYSITIGVIIIVFTGIVLVPVFQSYFVIDNNPEVKIGVIDSGCGSHQRSFVGEYKSFTTTQYGFFVDDDNLFDDLRHGEISCDLIHSEAPNAELFSARIANAFGQLTFQSILAAVEWLVNEKNVDIINLSLGSVPFISELIDTVFTKYQNQTTFVAASGNDGTTNYEDTGYIDWPAVYPWVIGVGSYNPNNSSLPASYTVGGLSYFGPYVTEYLDDGESQGKQGSSVSAPRITGKIGRLLYLLRQKDIFPDTNQLQAIFTTLTAGWEKNEFDNITGWGILNYNSLSKDVINDINTSSGIIVIHASNEIDIHKRFQSEQWTRKWKFNTYNSIILNANDLLVEGNGSQLVNKAKIELNPWGNILQIKFNASIDPGFYSIEISLSNSNHFSYGFHVFGDPQGKILLDHRTSINGYGHPYAEFSNFDNYLRSLGYIVEHSLLDDDNLDMSKYDSVILPRFAESAKIENLTLSRRISDVLLNQYENYVQNGGSLVMLADLSDSTNVSLANDYFSRFDAGYTSKDIGSSVKLPSTCCPKIVSNFTVGDISTDIVEFYYIGGEIISLNPNVTEIGWILDGNSQSGLSAKEYLSIGVYGAILSGKYMILGGTNFIANPHFNNPNLKGFNILFENFMQL